MSDRCLHHRLVALAFAILAIADVAAQTAGRVIPTKVNQGDPIADMVWSADDPTLPTDRFESLFSIAPIADTTYNRMIGRSLPLHPANGISRNDLRYLVIPHHDGHGNIRIGEMVCNKAIAGQLIDIFRTLFRERYPIERMRLVDDFDADDSKSMAANNTSCFNYRNIDGSKSLSLHARGMAVDINPLYNPMVKTRRGVTTVLPSQGSAYADRKTDFPYKIVRTDAACRAFRAHGFTWGGDWTRSKDYQHFQRRR